MTGVRVDLGDGPETVPVTGMSRGEWSVFCDGHDMDDEDDFSPALIAACTGLNGQDVWDEWPTDAAYKVRDACIEASAPRDRIEWAKKRIESDAVLETELAVAAAHHVPLSVFHAWPVRDQDLAIAWHVLSLDRCPGCHMPADTVRNPALGEITAIQCVHCKRLDSTRDEIPDEQRSSTHLSMRTTGGAS